MLRGGWHTEIALPMSLVDDGLAAVKSDFPGARTLVFGWGARDYYMAANPDLTEALRALLPGPAVMLVVSLPAVPAPSENAFTVFISRAGAVRLSRWLWHELAKGADSRPQRVAAGPYPQSVFYAASGSYDASHTCNTWTAEALRIAGLPIRVAGVVFADDVTAQLQRFTAPKTALPQMPH